MGVCTYNEGAIGQESCTGLIACFENKATIGDNSVCIIVEAVSPGVMISFVLLTLCILRSVM